MKVRVIRAYAGFSVGAIIPEMPGGQARTLIGRGFVEEVSVDKAMVAPANRAMQAAPVNRGNQTKPTLRLNK